MRSGLTGSRRHGRLTLMTLSCAVTLAFIAVLPVAAQAQSTDQESSQEQRLRKLDDDLAKARRSNNDDWRLYLWTTKYMLHLVATPLPSSTESELDGATRDALK